MAQTETSEQPVHREVTAVLAIRVIPGVQVAWEALEVMEVIL